MQDSDFAPPRVAVAFEFELCAAPKVGKMRAFRLLLIVLG